MCFHPSYRIHQCSIFLYRREQGLHFLILFLLFLDLLSRRLSDLQRMNLFQRWRCLLERFYAHIVKVGIWLLMGHRKAKYWFLLWIYPFQKFRIFYYILQKVGKGFLFLHHDIPKYLVLKHQSINRKVMDLLKILWIFSLNLKWIRPDALYLKLHPIPPHLPLQQIHFTQYCNCYFQSHCAIFFYQREWIQSHQHMFYILISQFFMQHSILLDELCKYQLHQLYLLVSQNQHGLHMHRDEEFMEFLPQVQYQESLTF